MTDHPINLRPWQVVAAVEGRLSVLVVPMKPQPTQRDDGLWDWANRHGGLLMADDAEIADYLVDMSALIVGERYWARETWMPGYYHSPDDADGIPKVTVIYDADKVDRVLPAPSYEFAEDWLYRFSDDGDGIAKRSPVTLPRWASRITIVPTEVRVCRLADVTDAEAIGTGAADALPMTTMVDGPLAALADTTGPGAYERNPWVAVARCAVHLCNIDTLEAHHG